MSNTLYFYKGTVMPMGSFPQEFAFKQAKKMLADGIRNKISLSDQADLYFRQLDVMEKALWKHCNPVSEAGVKLFSDAMKETLKINSEPALTALWTFNICALLIMKKISDDDMNGVMSMN